MKPLNRSTATLLALAACVLALPAAAESLGSLKPRPAEMATLAPTSLLLDIKLAGPTLVAVGDRGTILRSDDGASWTQVAVPLHVTLTALAFADASHGWAIGHDGAILHTADAGKTWAVQRFEPALNQALMGIAVLDTQRVVVVGAFGVLLSTIDGGKTWADDDAPAILEEGLHLNAVARLGTGELFAVGETGLLGISADGTSWERLSLPYEGSLFGVLPVGAKGAIVFGLRGNVLRSDDVRGGQWSAVDIGTVLSMFNGTVLSDGGVVLVGGDGAIVHIATDGKVSRSQIEMPVTSLGGGSLAAVIPWKDGLMIVGEAGANKAAIPR
ncbi:MAG TPA: YCF48-related protein [Fontimonas sp.]